MAFCWDEILVKRQTIEKLNLQLDLLFKADICKESFTLLESLLFQFDMKSTMRSKLKTCLSSELLDSNVVSLPVGSWSQVFIPQRSIIAGDQFELQRKSRGKSDFGEEFLILTLQVALLCLLLAWHSRDPLLKHFTHFNISGRACVGSGKFKGQCAFFRRHRLFDKVPSKISNTK